MRIAQVDVMFEPEKLGCERQTDKERERERDKERKKERGCEFMSVCETRITKVHVMFEPLACNISFNIGV